MHRPVFLRDGKQKMGRLVVADSLLSQLAVLEKPCNGRKRRFTQGSVMQEMMCRARVQKRWWYRKACLKCGAGEVRGT